MQRGEHHMSTEDNKAIVRRVFEEVLNQGNMALIDEVYSPAYVDHTPNGPGPGLEGLKQYFMMYRTAFPDAHYAVEDQIAEGGGQGRDAVVSPWHPSGATHGYSSHRKAGGGHRHRHRSL